MKIGDGCAWLNILLNGEVDISSLFRGPLVAHLKMKLLHVHVLGVVVCLTELKKRFEIIWY
uniref:Uncharacterized protein n=1 Tax=Arundo donax TaxID=35708 RepID=A0A0A9APE5_ARUDO